jgi:NADH dehydrogenase [ubiquinone] 1 alpha subcomplex assembly factor 6
MPFGPPEHSTLCKELMQEIAQIHDNVKDPTLGKMRMEWWREVVSSTFAGKPVQHPISLAIAECLASDIRLSQTWFKRILNAREKHLMQPQFTSMDDLENYAENTASSLLYLHLEALGIADHNADHCASHIGKAIGITNILRGVVLNMEKRELVLPSEIMAKVNRI